jgi:hypothetical protein
MGVIPNRGLFSAGKIPQRRTMIFPLLRPAATVLLILGALAVGRADEPAIIAKARAQLAPDAVLDAVQSIHYTGTMKEVDSAHPDKPLTRSIEIYLQKPDQQRIEIKSDVTIEISALDGYEAWQRTINAKDPNDWRQSQLGVDQIKQLRADVWQNLAFFRGLDRIGGRVADEGGVTIDGKLCEKLAFYHSDAIVYFRYFDQKTGDLVFTGTPENNIREQGDITSGGIRFPHVLVITQKIGDRTLTRTITFDKIGVNEPMPDRLFTTPLPTLKS